MRSGRDAMFSEALKIFDFLEIREVILPQFHCAKRNARQSRRAIAQIDDTMFSEALKIFDFLEIREVIITYFLKICIFLCSFRKLISGDTI